MRKAERMFNKNSTSFNMINLKKLKLSFKRSITSTKKEFYKNKILKCGNNMGKLYAFTNSLLGKSHHKSYPNISDDILCNNFSDFFISKIDIIYSVIKIKLSPPSINQYNYLNNSSENSQNTHLNQTPTLTHFTLPSNVDIYNLLVTASSASPSDSLPLTVMKSLANTLTPLFSSIINQSLITGVIPSILKHSIITPILKKNSLNINELSNFRPIAQLPLISKILEKIVFKQITTFIDFNNLSCNLQSAFRKNHSTETAITLILNDIYTSLDRNEKIQILLLDLSSAFDTLSFDILSDRLLDIGISSTAHDFLIGFVTNRTFSVKINNSYSKSQSFKYGVPQGSVLGPLLFSIYLNPITNIIKSFKTLRFHLYADDILIYSVNSRLVMNNELVECANQVNKWLLMNKLLLNTSKTELLNLPHNFNNFTDIFIDNIRIIPSLKIKYLGITIDNKLNFDDHMSTVCRKANFHLYNIRYIRKFISKDLTTMLMKAMVFSSTNYCNSIYLGLSKKLNKCIYRIDHSAVRLIYQQPLFDHSSVTLRQHNLNILNNINRSKYRILCIIHKSLTAGPSYIRTCLSVKVPICRELRSSNDVYCLQVKKSVKPVTSKRAFQYYAPPLWNSLPLKIRMIPNHDTFKFNLKRYLFNIEKS